ncbi:MAG: pyridoxal phosphate-dependent aminotransferase [Halieaceae bacterium]
MKYIRKDINSLPPSGIARVATPRLGDPSVIPLWFGEGDLVTPGFIRDAAIAALEDGETFYNFTRGTLHLREAIGDYLQRTFAVDVHPDRITVPGSSMLCVTIAAQMALQKGDHALAVGPHWPNIEMTLRITGAEFSSVRQRLTENGWELSAAEIIAAVQPHTRCIFVNSPCNPTGWVMTAADQLQLLEFCRERQILLIADEVYHRMVYDGGVSAPSFLTIAEEDDPIMIIYGLSKSWAMTGWRLGWVITPRASATAWQIMSENFNTGATVFAQRAAATALRDGEELVGERLAHYAGGRDIVMQVLGGHPRITLQQPAGAFYAFPRIDGIESSMDFALGLLEAEDVGVAPGYTFGEGNEQHIRICFARNHAQLQEGLERLLRYLDS